MKFLVLGEMVFVLDAKELGLVIFWIKCLLVFLIMNQNVTSVMAVGHVRHAEVPE